MWQAEECMNICPDSALTLLQGMEDSIADYPEEVQRYWHLLTIQAKDKQYITHTSDSLINQIVQYYEEYSDKAKLMLAYYYQGRVYRDMNDAPRALKAFQRAENLSTLDWNLLTKVYSQMGYLFSYQGLYDEVIRVNRKAIELYFQQGKEAKASYAWRDIARMYDMKEEADSAFHYYKKACHTALADNDSARYYGILSESAEVYRKMGMTDSALQILSLSLKQSRIRNKAHIYMMLGDVYEDLQFWDSAYYYRQKVLDTDNIYKKFDNYVGLAWIEKARGNEKQALHYMEQALWLNDSIRQITQTEAIAKINSLYNYQHTEAENARLQLSKERYEKMVLVVVLIALVAVGVCVYLVMGWKKERLRYQENERKLQEWQEKDRLKWELQQLRTRESQMAVDEQELAVNALRNSDVYRLFRRISLGEKMELEAKDWTELRKEINKAYPHFMANIQGMNPKMSLVETRICLLAKIGMTSTQMARVLGYSKSGVTSARDRLYKKMFNEKVTEEGFAAFIKYV
jgi:tetratricopeptide (TPR) repeat protein